MSGSVNRVILVGNLGARPEAKTLTSGAMVCEMRLATNESWKDANNRKQERTEWHRIVVWGKTAANCAQYLDKGRSVYVEGRLQTRTWDDKKTGEKRYMTEVVASHVVFLGGAREGGGASREPGADDVARQAQALQAGGSRFMGRKPGLPVVFLPPGKTIRLCRFTVKGRRYRLSTGARDLRGAEQAAQQLYAQAALGQLAPRRQREESADQAPPLTLLVARYLVAVGARKAASYVKKQRMHLEVQFLERWERLAEITPAAIERYGVERVKEAAATTVYKEMVTLSQILKWCKRNGYLREVPEFDRPKPVTDYQPPDLTREDVEALLAELPDRKNHHRRAVREFFEVQWSQGLRPGDVMALRWQDIDFRKGLLTVRATTDKARTGRTVGLAARARTTLEALAAEKSHHPASLVFGRCDYRESLSLAAKRAGLAAHVTPHHLRHARLSELAGNTRDLAALQFLAGHKRMSTTDRYVRSRTGRTVTLLAEADSGTWGVKKPRKRAPRKRRVGR